MVKVGKMTQDQISRSEAPNNLQLQCGVYGARYTPSILPFLIAEMTGADRRRTYTLWVRLPR